MNRNSTWGVEMAKQVVMDRGGEILEKGNISNVSNTPDESDVIQEMMNVIESVGLFGDYRRTQKKECLNLVRRMKLLVPLLEEIRELDGPIPDVTSKCLRGLKKALVSAKKLLKLCHDGSKIYLVSLFIFCFYLL